MPVDLDHAPPALVDFTARARRFLDGAATRRVAGGDAVVRSPSLFRASTEAEAAAARAWQRTVFDAGFGWICGPPEQGGGGLPREYERAYQQLERQYQTPSRAALGVSLGMVAPTLAEFGSPVAKQRWLRGLYRGDVIGCQLFSEPGAGSDLASVAARAERSGDGWAVTGQKVWTTGAHYSDIGLLLARSSAGPRHHNLSMFLIDMHAAGVDVRALRQMTGGSDFNEVFLTEVSIPDDSRLGDVDDGWAVAVATLLYERGAIGGAVGGGSGLFRLDAIAEWITDLGRADDPLVRQAYARVHCGVSTAKAMRRRAEQAVAAGGRPGPEMSLAKLALAANLMALSDLVAVVLGPDLVADSGTPGSFEWAEYVLGVPGMRLGGGTDEVQRDVVARRVLGLPRQ
jgi:alkylation response protein AidB-like acyl-CoA dehydrogenase